MIQVDIESNDDLKNILSCAIDGKLGLSCNSDGDAFFLNIPNDTPIDDTIIVSSMNIKAYIVFKDNIPVDIHMIRRVCNE